MKTQSTDAEEDVFEDAEWSEDSEINIEEEIAQVLTLSQLMSP